MFPPGGNLVSPKIGHTNLQGFARKWLPALQRDDDPTWASLRPGSRGIEGKLFYFNLLPALSARWFALGAPP
jgi:hypothetical protein